jgi:PAS domain S-box-containing protein
MDCEAPSSDRAQFETPPGSGAPDRLDGFSRFVAILCGFALGASALTLLGWFVRVPRLYDWLGTGIVMFPNTAFAAAALGTGILLQLKQSLAASRLAALCGLIACIIGAATLLQHISNFNVGIDSIILKVPHTFKAAAAGGRMGPPAACSFLLLGMGLILLRSRPSLRRMVPWAALTVLCVSALPLIGYIFRADPLFSATRITAIAFQTAIIIFSLAVALLASVPELDPIRILRQRSASGTLGRHSVFAIVLLPVVLGRIFVFGRDHNWFDRGMGTALFVVAMIGLSCFVLWRCIKGVARQETIAADGRDQLQSLLLLMREKQMALEREVDDMRLLHEISSVLVREHSVEVLYGKILDAAVAIMRSDMASMQAVDQKEDALRLLGWRGFPAEFGKTFELVRRDARTSCSLARNTGRRVVFHDIEKCDYFAGSFSLESHRENGIGAAQSTPLLSRSGELLGMISTHWRSPHNPPERDLRMLDILARQAADLLEKRKADENTARMAAIVEFSDDAIIAKDLNGIITSWNNGAQRLFGYSTEEAVGKSITMLIPEDRHHEEVEILGRLREGLLIEHYETVRRRKDGKLVEISLTISPIRDASGTIIGASKIARDISELRRAQEALARTNVELENRVAERTASLTQLIGQMEEFSYSVSHDLRAPIRTMQGYARAILEDHGTKLEPEVCDYLERICRSGERMDRLVRDILTYSRVSRAEAKLHPVALDMLIRDIISHCPELQEPRARVNVQMPLGTVLAHEPSLMQAISNLLNNAAKFVAPGVVPEIRIYSQNGGRTLRLWVADNGIGIRPEHQSRLFGLFQRIHPEHQFEGTGIGLAVVRKSVEKMGGRVGVESNGAGSRFWVDLPAAAHKT